MVRPVQCYVYDMTGGMARTVSTMFLGEEIEGIWHSSIVLDGVEHFYGYGLQMAKPGTTPFGKPVKILELGETEMPASMMEDLLDDLRPRYQPEDYTLITHNCNHFSNELSLLLTGNPLPEWVTGQGEFLLAHPVLKTLVPILQQMEAATGSATAEGFVDAGGNLTTGTTPLQAFMTASQSRMAKARSASPAATAAASDQGTAATASGGSATAGGVPGAGPSPQALSPRAAAGAAASKRATALLDGATDAVGSGGDAVAQAVKGLAALPARKGGASAKA